MRLLTHKCPTCSCTLTQLGKFCHDCGAEIYGAMATMIPIGNPMAFCPHCQYGLSHQHAYCPVDGKEIPYHLEINELSLYMHEVSTKTEFRFTSSLVDTTTIESFDVKLGEESLQQGVNRLRRNHEFSSIVPVLVDELVYPREMNQSAGIVGCPPGATVLSVHIVCQFGDKRYSLSAHHEITVMLRNSDPSSVVMHLGDVINSGEGSAVSTLRNKESNAIEMAQSAMQSNSVGDFINKMKAQEGLQYRPVKFFVDKMEDVEEEFTIPRKISWPSDEKARVYFEQNNRLQNYCLLARTEATFGRQAGSVDVRLVEIEAAMERSKNESDRSSSASVVSRKQWKMVAKENCVEVTQLSSLTCRISPGRAFQKNAVADLGLNEFVEIPDNIGLEVTAYERKSADLGKLYRKAIQYLKACKKSIETPGIKTLYGGFTLTRRHSLGPVPPVDLPDTKAAEYYVLMSAWATIGASETSNIRVTGDHVAPIHAYLVTVGGYYFISPFDAKTVVIVNGKIIASKFPYPVGPGDFIYIGKKHLSFANFSQMHLSN
jgi:hypothetical protein